MNTSTRRAVAIAVAFVLGAGAANAILSALREPPATHVDPIDIQENEPRKENGKDVLRDPKPPRDRDPKPRDGGDVDPGGGAKQAPPAPPPPAGDDDDTDDTDDTDDDNGEGDDGND